MTANIRELAGKYAQIALENGLKSKAVRKQLAAILERAAATTEKDRRYGGWMLDFVEQSTVVDVLATEFLPCDCPAEDLEAYDENVHEILRDEICELIGGMAENLPKLRAEAVEAGDQEMVDALDRMDEINATLDDALDVLEAVIARADSEGEQ